MKALDHEKVETNTLNQRYFYKIGSNLVTIFVGLFTSAIVPRALGVSSYGDFSYANNIITQLLTFLDMKASTCFYVKLSQRKSDSGIITFYAIYTVAVFLLLTAIIAVMTISSSRQFLFENIDPRIVWLSLGFVAVKWLADIFIKTSDAYGTTMAVERIKMANYILSLILLLLMYYFNVIDITTFYAHQIVTFTFFVIVVYRFFKNKSVVLKVMPIDLTGVKKYAKEFYTYSFPLALYLTSSLITEVFDRYILQHFGGSYQQGLYGFSFAISSMVVFFVTAMVPLFTRELSIAFSNNNSGHAASLYRTYVPVLYVVSAYFCCFLFVNAETVLMIFGGVQYSESLFTLQIMFLYPLISTYSNLNGSVVYAKSGNVLFRNIAFVVHPLGMIVAYLLISGDFFNLGAMGLAIKVVAVELVSVTIIMFFIAKHLGINLVKYFAHMVFSPAIIIGVALCVKFVLAEIFGSDSSGVIYFLLSGTVYSILLGVVFYYFPILLGLSKESINGLIAKIPSPWQ